MKKTDFRKLLREFILKNLKPGEGMTLKGKVRVENNSMIGYGDICEIYRHGAKGAAKCVDECDQLYALSELTNAQCYEVISLLPLNMMP